MPSPVAHSLVAYALHRGLPSPAPRGARLSVLAAMVIVASLPDADFLVGLVAGDANLYHHGVTHSIGFCALAACAAALIMDRCWALGFWKCTAVNGALLTSHLLLDALTADTRAPFGQPLFWPLWGGYLQAPVTVFLDVRRTGARAEFFASLWSAHNLKAVAWEILLVGPLVGLLDLWRRGCRRRT
ncbi:MAG: metal-dependent hydrolase [Calditrichaeota bacterium]|nr:metal-dependent hydrolase [Calditrichota bacterium]